MPHPMQQLPSQGIPAPMAMVSMTLNNMQNMLAVLQGIARIAMASGIRPMNPFSYSLVPYNNTGNGWELAGVQSKSTDGTRAGTNAGKPALHAVNC